MIPVNITVSRVPGTIELAAERALQHQLYQAKSWMFYDLFCQPWAILKMATAFYARKPIGVAVYWDYDKLNDYEDSGYDFQVGCFVKEEFRRHSVGRQLIQRIRVPKTVAVGCGVVDSRSFWNQVKPEATFQ